MIKKLSIIIIFLIVSTNILMAKESRNVTSVLFETYSYGGYSWYVEDVFITKITDNISMLFKGFHSQRFDLNEPKSETIYKLNGTIGTIINFGLFYSEFSYTLLGDLDKITSHSLYFDLTREEAKFLYSPSIKLEFLDNEIIVSPSFTYQYFLNKLFKIGGKLFLSFNIYKYNNSAIWVWGAYSPNIPLSFRYGMATGTLYSEQNNEFELDLSILPSIDYKINDKTIIKYNFKFNMKQNSYNTLSHEVVFDIKF